MRYYQQESAGTWAKYRMSDLEHHKDRKDISGLSKMACSTAETTNDSNPDRQNSKTTEDKAEAGHMPMARNFEVSSLEAQLLLPRRNQVADKPSIYSPPSDRLLGAANLQG